MGTPDRATSNRNSLVGGRSKSRKPNTMFQLVISSLVLGSAVAAPQDYQSYLSQLHQYRMEYLPESVNSYINKTWEEGRDVAYDLYDDIKEEVISKSDVHVDAMTKMMERFFERANEIHSSIKTVLEQEGALTDEEIQEFADLEEELEREAVEDENLPEGVEGMLQGMIRLCRQMMAAAADKEAEFWSKMKQLEVQFYQMKSASADTAASLRDWVTAAFQTMNEIDLNAIGGSSDKLVDEPRAN